MSCGLAPGANSKSSGLLWRGGGIERPRSRRCIHAPARKNGFERTTFNSARN
jgi:hypothetical protein